MKVNRIINGDCVQVMKDLPESSVDLVVTSPPYNVGIDYDQHKDNLMMTDYWKWTEVWLTELYRVLKDDGRVAINIPYETNTQDRGGRQLFMAEFWSIMKKVGYGFFGLVDLEENSPQRSKTTAWGSWMSNSAPYIYNPKECVLLGYKKHYKKKTKGEPQWTPEKIVEVTNEDTGRVRNRKEYSESDKKEFMNLVFGQWEYMADTNQLTKATFSADIPDKAIKILSYKDDVVLDPFSGSGTTALTALKLGRKYLGIELSKKYVDISMARINEYKAKLSQLTSLKEN